MEYGAAAAMRQAIARIRTPDGGQHEVMRWRAGAHFEAPMGTGSAKRCCAPHRVRDTNACLLPSDGNDSRQTVVRNSQQQREQQMSEATSDSCGWRPATRYPDPAIHALDPRFEKYWLKLSAVERLATALRWAEGPVWFGDWRYLVCSDIPNPRIPKWQQENRAVSILRKPSDL